MNESETGKRGSIWCEVTEQLSDHLDLAALEMRYETQQAARRLVAAAVVLILLLTGFIVLQVALVGGLVKAGLSMGLASFLLSLLYFVVALVVFWTLGRRDKRVGAPFIATQWEVHQTLRWIQKIFS